METILNIDDVPPMSLYILYVDIFLEELVKVSGGKIEDHTVALLIEPFVKHIALTKDNKQIDYAKEHIFQYLLKQSESQKDVSSTNHFKICSYSVTFRVPIIQILT